MQRIRIWDVPTRLFHWTLASSFALAWLTSEGDRWRSIHVFLGYLILGLVGFRLVWGFTGSHFSRFASFWFGPQAAFAYLKQVLTGHAPRHIGHNPTGSLAIYILLTMAVLVGATGIVTLGGDEQQGLATGWFSFAQIQWVKNAHEWLAISMLLVVAGHVTGVVVESVLHKENLASSMITGFKMAPLGTPWAGAHRLIAVVMLLAILAFSGWWFGYAIDRQLDIHKNELTKELSSGEENHVKFVGAKLPDNELWRKECKVCHVPFYPALLPGRSWEKIMAGQNEHFEPNNDLEMDPQTVQAVLKFLVDNAADHHRTEAAFKIDHSIPKTETPLRITETPYWISKHREISDTVWKSPLIKRKSNCAACHTDANAGTFEDAAMHIPNLPSTTDGPLSKKP